MSKINDAVELGLLRKYNLATAQVGDKVLGFDPGEVIALHRDRVVFGWENGRVNSFTARDDHAIYLAPPAWVEDRPVYAGDVLYGKWPGNQPAGYKVVGADEDGLIWDDNGRRSLLTDNMDDLTWTKPVTTIKINGHDVRAPERTAPPDGTRYWVPQITAADLPTSYSWDSDHLDARYLSRGLVHLTEEAATAHAKALLSFTEVRDA